MSIKNIFTRRWKILIVAGLCIPLIIYTASVVLAQEGDGSPAGEPVSVPAQEGSVEPSGSWDISEAAGEPPVFSEAESAARQEMIDNANRSGPRIPESGEPVTGPEPGTETTIGDGE